METVSDLAEHIADLCGMYGSHENDPPDPERVCLCRVCFATGMAARIRAAVRGDQKLARAAAPAGYPERDALVLAIANWANARQHHGPFEFARTHNVMMEAILALELAAERRGTP